jgi:hypothetical protein
MSSLKGILFFGMAAFSSRAILAGPVTLQFEGPSDTLCIIADYDRDPALDPPEGSDWTFGERDTVWQSTENGITTYDLRFTQNFQAELEGAQGRGWVNLYYSHYDYPHSGNYTFDAEIAFTFEKGDRLLGFIGRGSLFEDYAGEGAIAHGMGKGIQEGWGVSLDRYYRDVPETDPKWFLLTRITEGVAECPGQSSAWKYKIKNPKHDPGCRERPGRDPGKRR